MRPRTYHSRLLIDLSALLAFGNGAITFFDPNATDGQDGVYPSLRLAVENAKTAAGAGQPAEVVIVPQVDATGADVPIVIPALGGAIDLDGRVSLSNGLAEGQGRRPVLDFAEGNVITGARDLRNIEIQKNDGATPVLQWTSDDDGATVRLGGSRLVVGGTATGPLAATLVALDESIRFDMRDTSISKDPAFTGFGTLLLVGPGETVINTQGGTTIDQDTLGTAASHTVAMFLEADTVLQPQSLFAPGTGFTAAGSPGTTSLDGQDYDKRKAGGLIYWTKAQTFQPGYRSRTVLVREQLEGSSSDASSGMVRPAAAMYQKDAAPLVAAVGDTFSIAKDTGGTVLETWTAVAAAPAAFEFAHGADWGESVQNLADAIAADSATWGAVKAFNLRALGGAGSSGGAFKGVALVVYRLFAIVNQDDRIFADFSTSGAAVRTVNYTKFGNSYSADDISTGATTGEPVPSVDPGVRFGFGWNTFGPCDQGQAVYCIENGVVFQSSIGFGAAASFQGGWTSPAYDVTQIATATVSARPGQLVRFDPSGGAFGIDIADGGPATKGAEIVFKNVTADATALTITPAAGHTIDGAATAMIAAGRGTLRLSFDGVSDWMIV